eukprot:3976173-Amphidinium_carterae.1
MAPWGDERVGPFILQAAVSNCGQWTGACAQKAATSHGLSRTNQLKARTDVKVTRQAFEVFEIETFHCLQGSLLNKAAFQGEFFSQMTTRS